MDTQGLSFGRYLKSIRLSRGIKLETIAARTRIGMDVLRQIEAEDHERLPAEVFVKGFLRAYAESMDVDGAEVVNRYALSMQSHEKAVMMEVELVRSNSKFWLRILLALAGLASVIFITLMMAGAIKPVFFEEKDKRKTVEKTVSAVVVKSMEKPESPAVRKKGGKKGRLQLHIVAVNETWLKIIADGKNMKEYTMDAGNELNIEAEKDFNILIGNAQAVKLQLNEQPVAVQGKNGQIVSLQIP